VFLCHKCRPTWPPWRTKRAP